MHYHILVIDDDVAICELLQEYLSTHNYTVSTANTLADGIESLHYFKTDLIILDLMLKGESGIDFIARYKNEITVPVIMLSALGDVDDRINGLQSGANDYVTKPFEPKELLLRIKNLLRHAEQKEMTYSFGSFHFNTRDASLYNQNKHIHLTTVETELLQLLLEQRGEVVSREVLSQKLAQNNSRYIDLCIARLRNKIESNPKQPRFVQTVRGKGYVLYAN